MPAATGKTGNGQPSTPDLEADIRQLKADIEKLTEQLATLGDHALGAGRRAASGTAESLRAQGEAVIEDLRSNARDLESELIGRVREKPVTSLAIAAGVGFLLALITRR